MTNEIYDDLDELPAAPSKDIPEADRLLLELAARALGARFEEVDGEGYGNLYFEDGTVVYAWNPLVHSDDAFELQVTLRMSVEVSRRAAIAWFRPTENAKLIDCTEESGSDPKADARRAVTRAAAEVGKAVGNPA